MPQRPFHFKIAATSLVAALMSAPFSARSAENKFAESSLPLVHLRKIAPTVEQDMRYAGPNNFTGARVPGYEAPECLLTRSTALALAKVQDELLEKGFSLRVYDCYRPQQAVEAFVFWVRHGVKRNAEYFPGTNPKQLISLGYIASHSQHSFGNTVDLTLSPLPKHLTQATNASAKLGETKSTNFGACTNSSGQRTDDGTLDMGTAFDCFDQKSNTSSSTPTAAQRDNRKLLLNFMERGGFHNYPREWWHFSFDAADVHGPLNVPVR